MQDRWTQKQAALPIQGLGSVHPAGLTNVTAPPPLPLPSPVMCEMLEAEKWQKWLNLSFHLRLSLKNYI